MFDAAYDQGDRVHVPAAVLAQVWNGEPTQARLNQAFKRCKTIPLDEDMAHLAGRLRRISGILDVVDASVAAAAAFATSYSSVVIATSDEGDMEQLLQADKSIRPRLVHNEIRTHRA